MTPITLILEDLRYELSRLQRILPTHPCVPSIQARLGAIQDALACYGITYQQAVAIVTL